MQKMKNEAKEMSLERMAGDCVRTFLQTAGRFFVMFALSFLSAYVAQGGSEVAMDLADAAHPVIVRCEWSDFDNAFGFRAETVDVTVVTNDVEYKTACVASNDNWLAKVEIEALADGMVLSCGVTNGVTGYVSSVERYGYSMLADVKISDSFLTRDGWQTLGNLPLRTEIYTEDGWAAIADMKLAKAVVVKSGGDGAFFVVTNCLTNEPGTVRIPSAGLSKFDTEVSYDGKGHTIKTNELMAAFSAITNGETKVWYASGGKYENADSVVNAPSEGWSQTAPAFTDVCDEVVWYKVTNPNYEDYVHAAKVTIRRKRLWGLVSRNAAKKYDGLPLVAKGVVSAEIGVAWDGTSAECELAEGESMSFSGFATITEPGLCTNAFSYSFNEGTCTSNYEVSIWKFGELLVWSDPTVKNLKVKPIAPWGLSLDYDVVGAAAEDDHNYQLEVSMVVNGVTNIATTLVGETNCLNGAHRVYWDMAKDGISVAQANVAIGVRYKPMLYCVIDLSGGPEATSYPVAYYDEPPEGGFNTDEYKTTKLVMRRCPAGEDPLGRFTIVQDFYAGLFEVTEKQWDLVMGTGKGTYYGCNGPTYPVHGVDYFWYTDWIGSKFDWEMPSARPYLPKDSFMGRLSRKSGLRGLALPKEAQWEYAWRAGSTADDADIKGTGHVCYGEKQYPVGGSLPNAWGFYDMSDSLAEWCMEPVALWFNRSGPWDGGEVMTALYGSSTGLSTKVDYIGQGLYLSYPLASFWNSSIPMSYRCLKARIGGSIKTSDEGESWSGFRVFRTVP